MIGADRMQSGQVPARVSAAEVALYRLYDGEGALLYVGIAEEPIKRWYAHANRSWWPRVARFEVRWWPSRADAEAAERVAITNERPTYNVLHNRERALERKGASPVLTEIVLRDFRGATVTVDQLARSTGFSSTSARKTIRALVLSGHASSTGDPVRPRTYRIGA